MRVYDRFNKVCKRMKKTRCVSNVRKISYEKLKEIIKEDNNLQIVDTRSPQEFAENRIRFAINIPVYDLSRMAESLLPNKNTLIVLYCEHGERSEKAYRILEEKGYTNMYSLKGGIEGVI